MHILRELCTKDIDKHEVMSSNQYVLDLCERLEDTIKLVHEHLLRQLIVLFIATTLAITCNNVRDMNNLKLHCICGTPITDGQTETLL